MNHHPLTIASTALPINLLLSPTNAHRQRRPHGLRGSTEKPTLHPTFPDRGSDRPYYGPRDAGFPTSFPARRDRDATEAPAHEDSADLRSIPVRFATHHPTYPDWGSDPYRRSRGCNYPTTYPTYDLHPTEMPTDFDAGWDTGGGGNAAPTYSPAAYEEADRTGCQSQYFQLDIVTDGDGHEISWRLVRLPEEVAYQGDGYKSGLVYDDIAEGCLPPGLYEFTISDAGGNGIGRQGYYEFELDGETIAGGSDFGRNETTSFVVLMDGETGTPTYQPTIFSSPPSMEATISLAPTQASSHQDTLHDPFEIVVHHPRDNWVPILDEDFLNGFGSFIDPGTADVLYYQEFKERSGVVAIRGGGDSALESKHIRLGEALGDGAMHSQFTVVFSYFAYSMESGDGFCLETSVDGGEEWHTEKCWNRDVEFENGVWNDNVEVVFEIDLVESLAVRFRCDADSRSDAVMIDSVHLSDFHDSIS